MTFSPLRAPPLVSAFWAALLARLDTAPLQQLTGGAGRVVLEGDYTEPPASDAERWGRVVIVPTRTLWPVQWTEGVPAPLAWLLRTDWNPLRQPGYDAGIEMERAHRFCFEQLQHWSPGAIGGVLRVAQPVYLWQRWPGRPLWDGERACWIMSAEYRTSVTNL